MCSIETAVIIKMLNHVQTEEEGELKGRSSVRCSFESEALDGNGEDVYAGAGFLSSHWKAVLSTAELLGKRTPVELSTSPISDGVCERVCNLW